MGQNLCASRIYCSTNIIWWKPDDKRKTIKWNKSLWYWVLWELYDGLNVARKCHFHKKALLPIIIDELASKLQRRIMKLLPQPHDSFTISTNSSISHKIPSRKTRISRWHSKNLIKLPNYLSRATKLSPDTMNVI